MEGVILAQGSRFGGHALFIKDRRLHYVHNFLGIKPEQHVESELLEPGAYVLGVEFVKEKRGERGESHGTAKLYVGEDVVAEGPMRTQTGHFSLCGEVSRSAATPVTRSASGTRRTSRSRAEGSSKSRSASATTPTSTWSGSCWRRWRATE